ncbi:MAG: ABC transporter permease [Phycisphaerae bacterium]|nr:ABC transporter permease [Phycisphaerae bacterium]
MITQTLALFLDAYRELNARRLFWIVLGLSGLIVGSMACVANDAEGLVVLWWHIDLPFLSTAVMPRPMFYKLMFIALGINVWLTWAAMVLALVSTSGIIPEFVSNGSIEMALSKPIGRLRLFLTKYATGLLFVALQVTVFSLGAFLVLGVRGGEWSWRLFLAVPLVVLVFSYLYALCALIGLLTRSGIAALLLTVLCWLMIFLVHTTETGVLLQLRVENEQAVVQRKADLETREARLTEAKAARDEAAASPERAADLARLNDQIAGMERTIATRQTRLQSVESTLRKLRIAHSILFGVKTVMPKTAETSGLLQRALLTKEDQDRLIARAPEPPPGFDRDTEPDLRVSPRFVQREVNRILRGRSIGWVIGTSLAFEAAMVLLAAAWFVRKDY